MCELKKCSGCGAEKPVSEFYSHPQTKDGLTSKCKDCIKQAVKNRREANIDHYRDYDRQRAKDPRRKRYTRRYQQSPSGRAAAARYRAKQKAE